MRRGAKLLAIRGGRCSSQLLEMAGVVEAYDRALVPRVDRQLTETGRVQLEGNALTAALA